MEGLNSITEDYTYLWAVATVVMIFGAVVIFAALFTGFSAKMDRLRTFSRPPHIDNRVYQHIKSGRLYRLLYSNVYLEADYPNTCMCVYQSLCNGQLWTRPSTEFLDPERFVEIGEYDLLLEEALKPLHKQKPSTPSLNDLSFRGMA